MAIELQVLQTLSVDHHVVAAISLAGTCVDVFGSLFLAYDLLGGQHGPLRLITRAVTYSLVFGVGFALGLGPLMGLSAGLTTGFTVAIELHRRARRGDHYPLVWEALFSAIRGAGFGVGVYPTAGFRFAVAFGVMSTVGQVIAYSRGIRPSMDYEAARRPRLTLPQFWAALVRTVGYILLSLLCSVLIRHLDHPWEFAFRFGVVTGLATALGTLLNPFIEFYADNLPERRLGVFGILLILCGFALQSVQYWLAYLDIRVV
jgi:hypothetical protein